MSDLVIAETYHALQHHYDVPKAEAQTILRRFVRSGIVGLEPLTSAEALDVTGGAGLVDRLIHLRYRSLGAMTLTLSAGRGAWKERSGSAARDGVSRERRGG